MLHHNLYIETLKININECIRKAMEEYLSSQILQVKKVLKGLNCIVVFLKNFNCNICDTYLVSVQICRKHEKESTQQIQ